MRLIDSGLVGRTNFVRGRDTRQEDVEKPFDSSTRRVTYPESYVTKYTTYTKIKPKAARSIHRTASTLTLPLSHSLPLSLSHTHSLTLTLSQPRGSGQSRSKAVPAGLFVGVFQKSILNRVCQLLAIRAHKMAPRTGQGLQERAWNTPMKGLLWCPLSQRAAAFGRVRHM